MIYPGDGQDMSRTWPRWDQDVVRMWLGCGQDVARVWPGCDQDVARMWHCSSFTDRKYPKNAKKYLKKAIK